MGVQGSGFREPFGIQFSISSLHQPFVQRYPLLGASVNLASRKYRVKVHMMPADAHQLILCPFPSENAVRSSENAGSITTYQLIPRMLLRRDIGARCFSVPPNTANRRALSRAISASIPIRTNAVFSVTPVSSVAFRINASFICKVVLMYMI